MRIDAPTVRADHGAGSVLVLTLMAVVLLLTAALVPLGRVFVAVRVAHTGADLVALAAAATASGAPMQSELQPRAGPCTSAVLAAAYRVASVNRVVLIDCRQSADSSVIVTVAAPVGLRGYPIGPATARARAGPGG